jgi:hypothetical protein
MRRITTIGQLDELHTGDDRNRAVIFDCEISKSTDLVPLIRGEEGSKRITCDQIVAAIHLPGKAQPTFTVATFQHYGALRLRVEGNEGSCGGMTRDPNYKEKWEGAIKGAYEASGGATILTANSAELHLYFMKDHRVADLVVVDDFPGKELFSQVVDVTANHETHGAVPDYVS